MDPFSTTSEIILDLIFLKLNQEDLHEALRVSKSWFWASIRRMKKLKITRNYNPLKSIAEFYNIHRPQNEEEMDWRELFKHLVLDELIVLGDQETTNHLVCNGCNTARLTIEASWIGTPLTLSSLQKFTRLQSFEYHTDTRAFWNPFVAECFHTSDFKFDPNNKCPIEEIKLNFSGWNTDDPVLQLVTKIRLRYVTLDFLRALLDLCPNLEEIRCLDGVVTQEWHHIFPVNGKRIELHDFHVEVDVATIVDADTDAGRNLLPYLCQNWESVEKFHFDGYIAHFDRTVYEAFPQQREEVFECEKFNEQINLASPHFQSRKIHVKCDGQKALQLNIPPAKSVNFEFRVEGDFKFSPRAVCLEPGKVEHMSLLLIYAEDINPEPFGPNSFEGFCRLTSLTLSFDVNALAIAMALNQCPSIKSLKLSYLKAFTIVSMPRGSNYSNVNELLLDECEEPMDQVFQVFPCLSKFKQSHWRINEIRKTGDWLGRRLITEDKSYGVVFEDFTEIRYMVTDDFQVSLKQAQKLLNDNEYLYCKCLLKGFKLIPRAATQKVIYVK